MHFTYIFVLLLVALACTSGLRFKRSGGVTGPVHTYVKTDKHANFKWGVRHHVGKHYAGN